MDNCVHSRFGIVDTLVGPRRGTRDAAVRRLGGSKKGFLPGGSAAQKKGFFLGGSAARREMSAARRLLLLSWPCFREQTDFRIS